jgi:uncharacterized membrane protein YphA (DoxX/SURF4 family)
MPDQAEFLTKRDNVTAAVHSKRRTITLWIFRVILGVLFLTIGSSKLTGSLGTVQYFAAIGWGQWFRYVTGVLDVVGASLLFVPRLTSLGALAITCVVGSAALLALFRPGLPLAAPLTFTLLAASLAWTARPRPAR